MVLFTTYGDVYICECECLCAWLWEREKKKGGEREREKRGRDERERRVREGRGGRRPIRTLQTCSYWVYWVVVILVILNLIDTKLSYQDFSHMLIYREKNEIHYLLAAINWEWVVNTVLCGTVLIWMLSFSISVSWEAWCRFSSSDNLQLELLHHQWLFLD